MASSQELECPHAQGRSAPQTETTPLVRTPGPVGLVPSSAEADPLGFLGDLIDRYGDVVRYQTKYGPCFVFTHPEHVQTILHRENFRRAGLIKMALGDGLLASDGTRWRSQRRLMQKDFQPPAVAPFVSVMAAETRQTVRDWKAAAEQAEPVDVTVSMTQLTLRVIVRSLFSEIFDDAMLARLCSSVTQMINNMGRLSWTIFGAEVSFAPRTSAELSEATAFIDQACYGMVTRRRNQPADQRPHDLLTLLIEAETETGPMTDKQLRDELVTMLVGGHETTALAIAWAWKLLADHPAVAAEMRQEIDTVLAGREPAAADLQKLPFVSAVFQEAMRLYPPVWYIARMATADDVVGGHAIPRGAFVLVTPWFTHRHKDFWENPEAFNPSRFLNRVTTPQTRYSYFPFGGGRHLCLGMHFALLEGIQILTQLSQHFVVKPVPGEVVKPDPSITLRQTPSMHAHVQLRNSTSTC